MRPPRGAGSTATTAIVVLAVLGFAACGSSDGGGRGTGLSAVVNGNIANSGPDSLVAAACPFVEGVAVVSVRGTDLQVQVEADCTFELLDVPPGDITIDITTADRSNTVTVNDVPAETVVTLRDVRLGLQSADIAAIEVRPAASAPPREFAIIAEPPAGDAPLAVQFSFAPDPLDTTQVMWTFGDRSAGSNEFTPSHTYAAPGEYVVALAVSEPRRETQTVYLVVRVTEPPVEDPLGVRLAARPQSGTPPLTVRFQASVTGRRPVVQLRWDFGDGSPLLVTEQTTVEHDYRRAGSFVCVVTVTDDIGRQAGNSFPIVVKRSAVTVRPTPVVTATPARGSRRAQGNGT